MKSQIIHPFIEALVIVLEEATETKVKRLPINIHSKSVNSMGIASIIGLTGMAEGRVVLDMSPETACRLASKLNCEDIGSFDYLTVSTINEMANMICGRAVSVLANKGFMLEINPPTLFRGQHMDIFSADLETAVLPVETKFGPISLNIALRTK